ncbi:MAG: Zn-dependent M16 (insulinase) family peptidase [Halopseudomonas sp.]|jgi:Zn-dependent M16 (insulinase) family peptidase
MCGKRSFALGGEQTFVQKLAFQGIESQAQSAISGRLHAIDNQLIVTSTFVQAYASSDTYLQAVTQRYADTTGVLAEERATDLRFAVLEAEVQVARGGSG